MLTLTYANKRTHTRKRGRNKSILQDALYIAIVDLFTIAGMITIFENANFFFTTW